MKEKSEKILKIILVIVILAGITMLCVKGLNFELMYQNAQRIEINLGKTFDLKEMKQIVKEVFEKQPAIVQTVEVYQEGISITTKEVTEEQKTNLINKINEKYETQLKTEEIRVQEVEHTRGRDLLKPYWIPFAIATAIILIYLAIRYYKLNALKVVTRTIGTVILMQVVLLSILALTRIPVGRITIPMILSVYMLSLVWCTCVFEKERKEQKEENQE